jgi:hypothetical protein
MALEEALPMQTVTTSENSVFRNGPLKTRSLGCTAGPFMERLQRYGTHVAGGKILAASRGQYQWNYPKG